MAKIRLNLADLSVQEKLAKAQQIITSLTGNESFPSLTPPLTSLVSAMGDLKTADDEVQRIRQTAKEKTNMRNLKEDRLDLVLTQTAAFVESVAGDDEQLILSAGMDIRTPGVAMTDSPRQPQGLTATAGDHDGEIDLSWDTVSGAKSYVIEQSGDPVTPTTWAHGGVSTRSFYTTNQLTSGARYWFRVAAVNNNGQSGWSDPAMKIAP